MSSISLGSVIYTAVKPIFKIYFIIGLGFLMGKRNVLTVETSRNISDIVLTVILPCLIFSKIVDNIDNSDIKQIGIIVLTAVFLFISGGIGAFVAYLLTPVPKTWLGGCLSVGFFPNISDLPIAYIQTLDTGQVFTAAEGDKGVAYICIFLAAQTIFQFNLGGYRLIQIDFEAALKANKTDAENQTSGSETPEDTHANDPNEESISLTSLSSNEDIQRDTHSELTIKNRQSSSNGTTDEEVLQHENFLSVRHSQKLRTLNTNTSNVSYSTSVKNVDLRKMPSQTMTDLVNEYSQAENLRTQQPTVGALTELSVKPTNVSKSTDEKVSIFHKILAQLIQIIENCKRPPSIALIVSITISMIPWVKALFVVTSQAHIHPAPDGLPPLSFLMDLTSYVANACVPLGLLLLGATLSRLQVSEMPKGYWKVPLSLTVIRLILLPVIGVAFVNKLERNGWFEDDNILLFICAINFGLPNATALIYLTAFYTPPDSDIHLQMDYLSLTYIYQYPLLAISLPFLTTFVIKVLLKV